MRVDKFALLYMEHLNKKVKLAAAESKTGPKKIIVAESKNRPISRGAHDVKWGFTRASMG